jgi:hypothetical protein
MLNQNGTAILVAVVGVLSTILGSLLTILGNNIAVRKNNEADRRKIIREKIEEIYSLSNQIKLWIKVQLWKLPIRGEIIFDEKKFDHHFWFLDNAEYLNKNDKIFECPVERMEMLIGIYVPSLKDQVDTYHRNILVLKTLFSLNKFVDEVKIGVIPLKENREVDSQKLDEIENALTSYGFKLLMQCEKLHKSIQASLEKLVLEQ